MNTFEVGDSVQIHFSGMPDDAANIVMVFEGAVGTVVALEGEFISVLVQPGPHIRRQVLQFYAGYVYRICNASNKRNRT